MSTSSKNIRKRQEKESVADDQTILISNKRVGYDGDDDGDKHEPSDIRGDRGNIAILFFLYLLQGIPLGLTAAIPMLLQNRGVSYKQQAEFSFAYWPFSLKLLWAPIVDSVYLNRFGRRKSWLVPTQYLIGAFMLILYSHVNNWLGDTTAEDPQHHHMPHIPMLTVLFFSLNFLAATQDIAVDGWALTMLKPCNVGHASTCNSVGQTAGYFLGYVVFIALESKDFCNSYLGMHLESGGLVTLSGFLWFWGLVFLVTTTLVAIFKRETEGRLAEDRRELDGSETDLSIKQTYRLLWDIIKLKPIQILGLLLMTVKVTFTASDAVASLKLVDAGVPKDKLALLVVPLVPLQILLPLVISKYTTGPKPMTVYLKALPMRMLFGTTAAVIVYATQYFVIRSSNGGPNSLPLHYYILLVVNYGLYQIALYSMFVAVMAFFARISDPAVGGTYMTLLNTVCNLGGNWPTPIILWLVDVLTWRKCMPAVGGNGMSPWLDQNTCSNAAETEECTNNGGKCEIIIDGYYVEVVLCLAYGIVWYLWSRTKINELQMLPIRAWRVLAHGGDEGRERAQRTRKRQS